ncbi:MAG: ribosome maturation factor RimM [Acidaminococcaceae bacterium]|nr:ribosome maturation factor RimM [Acidaminococcaceae bacterium]
MQNQIVIGKIVAPHGVRGDIRILPLTETPEIYLNLDYLLLEKGGRLNITNARFQKNMVLLSTEEITNMDEAEKLRNQNVLVEKEKLPPLPEGRYYVSDLVGFACLNEEGEKIGIFKDTMQTGSNDVFVIKANDGKEILVPAIRDYILEINTEKKEISVRLPKWEDE